MSDIDRIYAEYKSLSEFVSKSEEPSLNSVINDNFRKVLLLATASYFEDKLTKGIIEFFDDQSGNNPIIIEFIKQKALFRQYHVLFDWDKGDKGVNKFYGYFGKDCRAYIKENTDEKFRNAETAFIEIGNLRNNLVHNNYASFVMEKTSDEIYESYKIALVFVEHIFTKIRLFREAYHHLYKDQLCE